MTRRLFGKFLAGIAALCTAPIRLFAKERKQLTMTFRFDGAVVVRVFTDTGSGWEYTSLFDAKDWPNEVQVSCAHGVRRMKLEYVRAEEPPYSLAS
jgi:hypothetical protein